MSKHKRSRLGLTKGLRINTDAYNTFRAYGEGIGSANADPPHVKKVRLKGKHHDWDDPVLLVDIDANTLEITAYCHKKKNKGPRSDDDLNVTITLDPGTQAEDLTECTFPDVEHDD